MSSGLRITDGLLSSGRAATINPRVSPNELREFFDVIYGLDPADDWSPRYNVTPTMFCVRQTLDAPAHVISTSRDSFHGAFRYNPIDSLAEFPCSFTRLNIMNYLHQEFDADSGDLIEVTLDGQANVLLLDESAYSDYRQGRAYKYYGGLAKVSPMRLPIPHQGHWHVVVDLGGYSGSVKASIRMLQGVNS